MIRIYYSIIFALLKTFYNYLSYKILPSQINISGSIIALEDPIQEVLNIEGFGVVN